MKQKTCTRCGEVKPLDAYGKHPDTRDGRQSWCNQCRADYIREERAKGRFNNREQKRAYSAAQRRLREAHRAEFEHYYSDEKIRRGVS